MLLHDDLAPSVESLTWLDDLYMHLHSHPELSMREHATCDIIEHKLNDFGYTVQRIGGGVVGVLANGSGACVLTRADMDALPVSEQTGLPYSSQAEGVMHACGHDVHVAGGLGAAAILAQSRHLWHGTHIALFQPGEETAAGAQAMLDAGLVGMIPRPNVCLAQHVLGGTSGHVMTADGPVLSAGDSLRITIHGRGSHGSMPHLSCDPIVIAASIISQLQTLVSRTVDPNEFAVVTVGSVHAGTKSNIIPETAELLVNTRAYSAHVRDSLIAGIERIVRTACEAAQSPQPPEFELYDSFPLTANNTAAHSRLREAYVSYFGNERVDILDRLTASEDFSRIPDAFGAPYVYSGIGGFDAEHPAVANHNPSFAPVIQPTLTTAAEALAVGALAWLC